MDIASYRRLLDVLFEGVYFVDRERRITCWSRGAERITGYREREVLGAGCADAVLAHIDERGENACAGGCPVAATLADGQVREAELYLLHREGHRVPVSIRVAPIVDAGGEVVGAVEVFTDNPSGGRAARLIEDLRAMALLDSLTELGNRRYLDMRLGARIKELERYGWPFGVLFADIDRFKAINDRYGHDVGDKVLRVVARTLLHSVRSSDIVGRWGGEEFLAIIVNVGEAQLLQIADKLRSLVERCSFSVGADLVRPTISVGATLAVEGDTVETLVRRADRLMYRSKAAGRNRVSIDRGA